MKHALGGRMDQPFGEALRSYRIALGLTQEVLGEQALLSAQAVGALERGARRFPRRDTVSRLADALQLAGEQRAAFMAAARRRGKPKLSEAPVVATTVMEKFAKLEGAFQELAARVRELEGTRER